MPCMYRSTHDSVVPYIVNATKYLRASVPSQKRTAGDDIVAQEGFTPGL